MFLESIFDNFKTTYIPGEVISSLIVMFIIAVLAIIVGIQARRQDPLKKSKGLLLIAELGTKFFDNMVYNLAGKSFEGLGGFILGIATYLFISFIFGLTGLPSPVTYMAVPLSLGLTTFLFIHITSARFTKWKYFKRYVEPFAVFLPVNLISMWAPLISLTFRLFGNAIAGWALMTIVYTGIESIGNTIIGSLTVGHILAPFITPVLHAYFDLWSGFIQTTVFLSLTIIFIGNEEPEPIEGLQLQERR